MINFPNQLSRIFAILLIVFAKLSSAQDTLNLGGFLFVPDTNTIFKDSSEGSFILLDTTHNMAISLKSYQGVFDLDSLVDINFKPVAGFEFERDSLRFDSSDLSYYFKYATAELEDSLTYVVFALAVQYEDAAVIFQNALIEQHPESEGYHNQIFNVTFENYERPVTTKAIHRNFKLDKKMRAVLDGWVRIKGRDLRGRI